MFDRFLRLMQAIGSGFLTFSCRHPNFGRTDPLEAEHPGTNQYLNAGEVITRIHQARCADGVEEDATCAVFHVTKNMLDASAYT